MKKPNGPRPVHDSLHPRFLCLGGYPASKDPAVTEAGALKWASQAEALTCEPVLFELRYLANQAQSGTLEKLLSTVVCLPTPPTLWEGCHSSGSILPKKSLIVPPVDLLVVTLARHHGVGIVTSDAHFSILKSIAAFHSIF